MNIRRDKIGQSNNTVIRIGSTMDQRVPSHQHFLLQTGLRLVWATAF